MSSGREQDVIGNEEVDLLTIQKISTTESKSNEELEGLLSTQQESSIEPRIARLRSYSDSGKGTFSIAKSSWSRPVSPEIQGFDVYSSNANIYSGRMRLNAGPELSRTIITKVDTHSEPRKNVSATSNNEPTDNSDVNSKVLATSGKATLGSLESCSTHSETIHDHPLKVDDAMVQPSFLGGQLVEQQIDPPSNIKLVRKSRRRPPTADEDLDAIVPCPIPDQRPSYPSPGEVLSLPPYRYLPLEGRNPGGRPEEDASWGRNSSLSPEAAVRSWTSVLSGDEDTASSVSERCLLVRCWYLIWGIFMLFIGIGFICAAAWVIVFRLSETDASLVAAIFIIGIAIYILAVRSIYKSVNWRRFLEACGCKS